MDNTNNNDQSSDFTDTQIQNQTPETFPATQSSKPARKMPWPILVAALGVLLLGAVAWGYVQYKHGLTAQNNLKVSQLKLTAAQSQNKQLSSELTKRKNTTGEENIDPASFQAVFLKNDQVYFGKITKLTETQVVLTDIFYLQNSSAGDVNGTVGNVSLVKLGSELHAPQDTMYIERAELNYWENLKPDGKVAKAIAQYQAQNR